MLPHLCGFSFFLNQSASSDTPDTFITLNLTPGISPTAWPFLPNPATTTLSFSSINDKEPSLGTNAVIFLLFFLSWTLTHFLMAEFGCFASMANFSVTIPAAVQAPSNGFFHLVGRFARLYVLLAHLEWRRVMITTFSRLLLVESSLRP